MHDLRPREKTFYEMKIYSILNSILNGCFYVKDCNILVSQIGFLQAAWRIFGKLCCVHVIQSGVIKNRTNFSLKYQIRLRRGAQVRGGGKLKMSPSFSNCLLLYFLMPQKIALNT